VQVVENSIAQGQVINTARIRVRHGQCIPLLQQEISLEAAFFVVFLMIIDITVSNRAVSAPQAPTPCGGSRY